VDQMAGRTLGPRVDNHDGKTVGIAALQQRDAFADVAAQVGAAFLEHTASPVQVVSVGVAPAVLGALEADG
jgi:hypothetical protein